MKALFVALVCLVALPLNSFAGRATPLKGWYQILSQQNGTPAADEPAKEFFLVDTGTLAEIWARHAKGPLPGDLESVKNEDTILTGFTNRDTLFLALEKTSTIGSNFLAIRGDGKQMELRRHPDLSGSELAVVESSAISLYRLAPATAEPSAIQHVEISLNY